MGVLVIVLAGFLLGARHATDPDHVIAISTIVSREGGVKRGSLIGAAWGVGHTLTILVVGSAMIFLRIVIPARLGLAMELAVGLMLTVLGMKNVMDHFFSRGSHSGAKPRRFELHAPGDYAHAHHLADHPPHAPRNLLATMDRRFRDYGLYRLLRPFVVGMVHGLAGSAAVVLLVLGAIPNPAWAVAYLAVFGVGTVLGMMLITVAMRSAFMLGQRSIAPIGQYFSLVAGLVSFGFGLFLAYEIGFVHGLFSGHAVWEPR